MRSSKISMISNKKILFLISMYASYLDLFFVEIPVKIELTPYGSRDIAILVLLKIINYRKEIDTLRHLTMCPISFSAISI